MSDIVNKLWGFCHQMRHDGIDYGDYIEQLTHLLFLNLPCLSDLLMEELILPVRRATLQNADWLEKVPLAYAGAAGFVRHGVE
jgi:hypothetical protein